MTGREPSRRHDRPTGRDRSTIVHACRRCPRVLAACGSPLSRAVTSDGPDITGSGPVSTYGRISPPPAEVLDADVVFFDADGADEQPDLPPPAVIADVTALEAFVQRYVDGELPRDDPDLACTRAITSIALMAIDVDELPAGLPIRGT